MKKCVSRGRAAPPSDEGGVTEGEGGRERRVGRLVCATGRRGADPYRKQQKRCRARALLFPTQKTLSVFSESVFAITG